MRLMGIERRWWKTLPQNRQECGGRDRHVTFLRSCLAFLPLRMLRWKRVLNAGSGFIQGHVVLIHERLPLNGYRVVIDSRNFG